MSQTKKTFDNTIAKEVFCKNAKAIKVYWPILLLAQIPLLAACILLTHQNPVPQAQIAPDKKNVEIHRQQVIHIKNIEQRLDGLNQRFLALQNQHAKMITSLISLKTAAVQQGNYPSVNSIKKTTLETLDRIGEKIRLNEPFSGLLTNLPKDCTTFSGYKTLHQFSARLPFTFSQLKKTFEDIRKNYTPPKVNSDLPKWLEKFLLFFSGNIKIEKVTQVEGDPFQPIAEALEAQDLKLANSLAKDIKIQSVKSWAKSVTEHILLEEEYSLFAEKVQNWAQQAPLLNEAPPTNIPQENLP